MSGGIGPGPSKTLPRGVFEGGEAGNPYGVARGRRKSISAKPEHKGGLSRATDQIHGLLEELTDTVESAERLTRRGQPERALNIVEEARESLYNTVDSISREVATKPRSRFEKLRNRTPILVAAALLTVSGMAIAVGAITSPHEPTPAQLRRAESIADPATRMTAIYNAYRAVARANPSAVAPGTAINREVTKALKKTKTDMQSDPTKTALVDQAGALIDAVSHGQVPPPPPAPTAPPAPGNTGTGGSLPPLP